MNMKIWLFSIMLAFTVSLVPLQTVQPVMVRDNILLGYVGDCCGQDQSIAVDPNNPNRIVAAAGVNFFNTDDGGRTWTADQVQVGAGDPSLAFDANGPVYWASVLGYRGLTSLGVFRSTDGGTTWTQTQLTNWTDTAKWLNDKEWLAVDTSQSQFHGRIYVVWDVFVNGHWNSAHNNIVGSSFGGVYLSYSDDHGITFSKPAKLPQEMYDLQIAVGRAGEVYIVGTGRGSILLIKSTDGCRTFGPSSIVAEQWKEMSNPLPHTKVRTNTMPFLSLAVDERKGKLYVAWTDAESGDGDILLSRSANGGASWSSPIRVNDDPWADNKDQLMPSVTVSLDDIVHVAWVDRRNDSNNVAYDIYYAKSDDGGNTFSKNLKVSIRSSDPNTLHDPTFIGDYLGISSGSDGTVHVVWGGVDDTSGFDGLAIFEATIIYKPGLSTSTASASTTTTTSATRTTSATQQGAPNSTTEGVEHPQPLILNYVLALAVTISVLIAAVFLSSRHRRRSV
jgi:hypothetical protein